MPIEAHQRMLPPSREEVVDHLPSRVGKHGLLVDLRILFEVLEFFVTCFSICAENHTIEHRGYDSVFFLTPPTFAGEAFFIRLDFRPPHLEVCIKIQRDR